YQALGEMEQARLYTLRGFERARRYGVQRILGWLHWNSGAIALAQGNWTDSESHLQQALQEAEHHSDIRLKPVVIQAQAELAFRQGQWKQAEQFFQASITAAANTEWYPSTLALYGHFLAVTGRRAQARAQLDRAAAFPEPPGFGGDFYIPFLAEGYLHLDAKEQAAQYIERITKLRGFLYYGNAVDRIRGIVAIIAGDWEQAEQAFEEGLTLCRRAHNAPEEAQILYEQARAALIQNGSQDREPQYTLEHIQSLCERARAIFAEYGMQRAVTLVDTLQEGMRQLERRDVLPLDTILRSQTKEKTDKTGYILDIRLTKREQEVLRLVAEGHTDREVAETLVISPRTVNRHLSNIFVKLDMPGRAAAVAYAIRQGMV
ncbi:MAG: LuxR C-terminal-related transcriptional regulator, partial [Chloroflexota bacterium]|nr:LuxR C-terminal-related transcriptional regulator [Chloroflexota bacterium]